MAITFLNLCSVKRKISTGNSRLFFSRRFKSQLMNDTTEKTGLEAEKIRETFPRH